ncbi:hemolysin family protein [Georgenia sp. 10Sc9-8]|uniref:Hemolysin family protein n=1 Tax=Georgenia halotolerans TaxID=3028317 RepID=A0ABT5TUU4_9MICO|nr:hemolysin family protein [Georgenia halotolerans]
MTEWLLLGLVVVLIGVNALFVAVEFSFLTVDRSTAERAGQAGDKRAASVAGALGHLSSHLSGAQLGITISSLLVGYIAEPSLAALLRGAFGLTDLNEALTTTLAVTLAFVIATGAQMVFGELVPKNWGIAEPMRVARAVVRPQKLFMLVLGWLVRALNGAANAVVRALGFEPQEELASARTAEELSSVVMRSGKEGTLDPATAELVTRSIEFGGHTARDVMRPRPRVTFLQADDPVEAVLKTATATGHSRFPVAGESTDDIVGLVHFKHALAVPPADRDQRTVASIMAEPLMVSESMTLDPLLREMRKPGLQLAVVVDEYGGTAGIVTLEDLIEEIVGEIDDEQDTRTRRYRRTADGGWLVSGLLRPDELSDILGLELPEGEESDTMAGLVAERLDRLPQAGDAVVLEVLDAAHPDEDGRPTTAELAVTVDRMDGHRVDRVAVRRRRPATEREES